MAAGELVRNWAFQVVDRTKGGLTRKHLQDLKRAFADVEQGKQLARRRLDEILRHAVKTTAYYKKYADFSDLGDFPVIQKKTIKDNYDDFLSSAFDKAHLTSTTTSGSYGMPFRFYLTKDKRARQQAEVIFFSGWAGYKVGMKYCQVRAQPMTRLTLFMQNGFLMNPSIIDEDWLRLQRNRLKHEGVRFMIGYPSAIKPIADYCRSQGDEPGDFKLKGIITGAETLLTTVRDTIEQVFGCPVLDRYSSNELGVISHECPANKTHHLNFATHQVELLSMDTDTPASPGEIGRVVVTDYFSHAMPLIRYDTGDIAVWDTSQCPCGLDIPAFKKIEGRVVATLLDPRGTMINFEAIDRIPKDLTSIVQFQFIQKSKDTYVVKLHVMPGFNEEDILMQRFKKVLTDEAKITFDYVDSIPPLPSGKRPYIINEYKKNSL